ncbi:hypothetical protein LIER_16895 [Lithospermum erythrorhizon]|uniref:Uncharacterized protein n=1 Tax=Lithospermum erythrorhizon TaxID=34254 RepID=A0AAV3Q9R1_LITER
MVDFNECLEELELDDHVYKGFTYTWCANWKESTRSQLRKLDRVLCNEKWIVCSPTCKVYIEKSGVSDHCKLRVMMGNKLLSGPKPFRYQLFWEKHETYNEVVNGGWSKEVQGNEMTIIEEKMKSVKAELQKLNEERNQRKKHRRLSQAEEMLLQSKSRSNWLELGDANNKFFHSSLISRKSRNKLCTIKDAIGVVLIEPKDVINKAVGYFRKMFQVGEGVIGKASEYIQGRIPEHCIQALIAHPTRNEVKQAMNNMKKEKCPGPDGLSADFYQKNWSYVEEAVFKAVE